MKIELWKNKSFRSMKVVELESRKMLLGLKGDANLLILEGPTGTIFDPDIAWISAHKVELRSKRLFTNGWSLERVIEWLEEDSKETPKSQLKTI